MKEVCEDCELQSYDFQCPDCGSLICNDCAKSHEDVDCPNN